MYKEVPFECSMCGRCCEQRLVLLNTADIHRIAGHFGMSEKEFMEKYDVVFATTGANTNPRLYLRITGNRCPFYLEGKGCSIHEIKPLICRLFPGLKYGQTARDIKDFVKKHALSNGIRSCKIFDMPDDIVIGFDHEALITTIIYDSIETIYYRNTERNDMDFALRLLKIADRKDLRDIVSDYLYNENKESGLVFEQTMFEIQAMCQVFDWKKTPVQVAHQGVAAAPGIIYAYVNRKDAMNIMSMNVRGDIEAVFSQANPSVADPSCMFISVAIKTKKDTGFMLALPILKKDMRKASMDGKVKLGFYASDGSMDNLAVINIYVDPTVYK